MLSRPRQGRCSCAAGDSKRCPWNILSGKHLDDHHPPFTANGTGAILSLINRLPITIGSLADMLAILSVVRSSDHAQQLAASGQLHLSVTVGGKTVVANPHEAIRHDAASIRLSRRDTGFANYMSLV